MITLTPSMATAARIGALAVITGGFYLQPYRPMVVVGRSMEPTYHNHLLTWTEPVKKSELRRGQVVVINMSFGTIVKRIKFMPGDKIPQMKVDGQWCDLVDLKVHPRTKLAKMMMRQKIVPAGEVYVLGDNSPVSMDSRKFGFVPEDQIERILVDQRPLVHKKFGLEQTTPAM